MYGLDDIKVVAEFASKPDVMDVKQVDGVWEVVHTTCSLGIDVQKAQQEWEVVWPIVRNEYRQLLAHTNALQVQADTLDEDGDSDLLARPHKKRKTMQMIGAWEDWILKQTGNDRYQNVILLLRIMLVFSSNSACCERSGSAMSLIKTNRRNKLSDSTLMYLQLMYTYRLLPTQLDWDRVVSRFMKKETNPYFDYFYK